jgi:hypothetical protein
MADKPNDRATYAAKFIKGDWDRAVYLDNPHIDNLMTAFMAMGAEMWTMRRRMKVIEKLLGEKRVIDLSKIEAYVPTAEEQAAWQAERDEFIHNMFAVFTRETNPVLVSAPAKPKDKP